MAFPIDAPVLVISIGKTGRIVEAGRGGRYRVRVGGLVMACREEDLAPAAERDRARKRRHPRAGPPPVVSHETHLLRDLPSPRERRRLASLDLHGFTVEEALREVEARLDAALRAGLESVEIIHGRGSGRIKVAVHRLLGELSAVRHFEIARDNPGVTRVFF